LVNSITSYVPPLETSYDHNEPDSNKSSAFPPARGAIFLFCELDQIRNYPNQYDKRKKGEAKWIRSKRIQDAVELTNWLTI
jgi:hypothetical protein